MIEGIMSKRARMEKVCLVINKQVPWYQSIKEKKMSWTSNFRDVKLLKHTMKIVERFQKNKKNDKFE